MADLAQEKYDPPVPAKRENLTKSSQQHRLLGDALLRLINVERPLEETAEVEHRQAVLRQLRKMIVDWIKQVWVSIGYPAEQAEDLGGALETSGSFRLGVNDPGGDIDTICIVPQHVTHADFFGLPGARGPEGGFVGILQTCQGVHGIKPIPSAKVPLIKIDSFQGVEIDLLLARLPLDRVPQDIDDEIDDESILNRVEFASLRALSGPRDNIRFDRLLEHVDADLGEFQLFLRLVRYWAKARGLWGNKYGYFGGVNCAILCIKVIQHFPNKRAASLLRLFFHIFTAYPWGPRRPLFISKVGMLEADGMSPKYPNLDPDLGFFQYPWEMPHGTRRDGLMPIITPCYPVIDSMSKATRMSVRLFRQEFARGKAILAKYVPTPKRALAAFELDGEGEGDGEGEREEKEEKEEGAGAAGAAVVDAAAAGAGAGAGAAAASTAAARAALRRPLGPDGQPRPLTSADFEETAQRLGKELFRPLCFPAQYKYFLQVCG
jgi:poly(A) polymerase